jgi:hypothetical protein
VVVPGVEDPEHIAGSNAARLGIGRVDLWGLAPIDLGGPLLSPSSNRR